MALTIFYFLRLYLPEWTINLQVRAGNVYKIHIFFLQTVSFGLRPL